MKSFLHSLYCLLISSISLLAQAGGKDDPFLVMPLIDQLETSVSDGDHPTALNGELWAGYDLNRLWLKVEGEREKEGDEAIELQALYSRAISAFWNLQVGARSDFISEHDQDWAVFGVKGLAPYFFDIDAALFLGSDGRSGLRLEAEYELMLTQRLILSPEIELNAYGQNDARRRRGAGLADVSAGLRLRYEFRREFAPYIGLEWQKKLGNTADFAREDKEDTEELQLLLGVRLWF